MECMKLLVIALCFNLNLQAQNSQLDTLKYRELGIGLDFINSILPIENNIGTNSPYQVYFNLVNGNRHNRFAFNLSLDGRAENNDEIDSKTRINEVKFKLDYARGKSLNVFHKFDLIYGWKWSPSFSLSRQKTTSETNPNSDVLRNMWNLELGSGPFAGLQYNVFKSFSIYLEVSYQIFVRFAKDKFDSVVDSSDFQIKEISYNSSFSAPRYLVLLYSF